jgi:hypothetical protein
MGAFATEPRELRSLDEPVTTGGGSIGYNENVYDD